MKITDLKDYTVIGGAQTGIPVTSTKKKSVGQKVLNTGTDVANFFGAKGISEQFGADVARLKAPGSQKNFVDYPTQKQVVGSALQTGANIIPGVGKGASLAVKAAVGAGTGLAFDAGSKLQEGKSIPEAITPGVGAATGAALPVVGKVIKPATSIISRLFKGLGSGLSGVSTDTIDKIVQNPEVAQKASDILAKNGNNRVLEKNAKEIVNGISSIRQEARKAFGDGLESLAKTDIESKVFRDNTQKILDKYGSKLEGGKRTLSNVEFSDPKNVQKASELIDRLSNAQLDGKSLRKLADDIENATYKIATSDERLSFNAFVKDLSSGLKESITSSTPKLAEMNSAFSQDMQLAEAMQNIFGKVNFKNLPEVVKASQKLDTLFAQKGLAPEVVDNFLTRIGSNPESFKTTEAVRQISNKSGTANSLGTSFGEIARSATSSVVTPKMVKNIAIYTGLAEQKVLPFLKQLKPSARNVIINALIQANQQK